MSRQSRGRAPRGSEGRFELRAPERTLVFQLKQEATLAEGPGWS